MFRGTESTFQLSENPAVKPQAGSLVPLCCGSSSPLWWASLSFVPSVTPRWENRDLLLHRQMHMVPSTASSKSPHSVFRSGKLCVLIHWFILSQKIDSRSKLDPWWTQNLCFSNISWCVSKQSSKNVSNCSANQKGSRHEASPPHHPCLFKAD